MTSSSPHFTSWPRIAICTAIGLTLFAGPCLWPVHAQNENDGPRQQPGERPRPTARPTARPPIIPAFDRESAQRTIDNIDQERNALVLRMGLFVRPRSSLSTAEALTMLEEAVKKEPEGNKRWFLLQSVRGFGGFQTPNNAHIANQAYAAMFDRVAAVPAAEAFSVFEQALSTYLNTVEDRRGLRRGDNSTSPEILLKAFKAYLQLPPNPTSPQPLELRWEQALQTIGGEQEFVAVVERLLKEPGSHENYRLLRAAASAYDRYDPERAIELLQQTRPLVQRQHATLQETYYEDLVRLLATNNQLPAAITAQQEYITLSGRGNAQLLVLYDKANDTAGLEATVSRLLAPDSNETALVETATALRSLSHHNQRLKELTRQLHSGYLTEKRPRTPELELRVRLSLSNLLKEAGKPEEAKELLTFDHIKPPFESIDAQRSYEAIQRTLAAMNKTKAREE